MKYTRNVLLNLFVTLTVVINHLILSESYGEDVYGSLNRRAGNKVL